MAHKPSDEDPNLKQTLQLPPDPSDHEEDLLNVSDFQSIELKVKITNTTAQTPIREQEKIKVIELLDAGIILQILRKSCSVGHHLALEIGMSGGSCDGVEFRATGKVEEIEDSGIEKMDQITIKFLQFTEKDWSQIRSKLDDRQKEINQFFQAARGH